MTHTETTNPIVKNILRIETSLQGDRSITRTFSDLFYEKFEDASANIINRDISKGLPLIDTNWVGASFTPDEARTKDQHEILAFSDTLINELEDADIITIGLPIYNFSIPASFKLWIDLITRARKTFRYTENGPEGLLTDKKVYVFVASGGTLVGSDMDFATGYVRHILGFMGLNDIHVISADQMATKPDESLEKAKAAGIETVKAAA